MYITRFEVDKFTIKNYFTLWRIKMKALLVQQGLSAAINETATGTLRQFDAAKAMDVDAKAHNATLLSLGDEVLRVISS